MRRAGGCRGPLHRVRRRLDRAVGASVRSWPRATPPWTRPGSLGVRRSGGVGLRHSVVAEAEYGRLDLVARLRQDRVFTQEIQVIAQELDLPLRRLRLLKARRLGPGERRAE